MKDEGIDFTDIPEKTNWNNAVVGKFYRPIKKSLTIRIDADVLAWVKRQGKGIRRESIAICVGPWKVHAKKPNDHPIIKQFARLWNWT
jgi:hypothetical protein